MSSHTALDGRGAQVKSMQQARCADRATLVLGSVATQAIRMMASSDVGKRSAIIRADTTSHGGGKGQFLGKCVECHPSSAEVKKVVRSCLLVHAFVRVYWLHDRLAKRPFHLCSIRYLAVSPSW